MGRMSQRDKIDRAFDYYYALGPGRTYQKVAEKFGVSVNTVNNKWAVQGNWRERKLQRDLEVRKLVENQTNLEIADIKAHHREDIKAALFPVQRELQGIIDSLKGQKTPGWVKNASDFDKLSRALERLIKLNLQLIGKEVETVEEKEKYQVHFYIPKNNRDPGT